MKHRVILTILARNNFDAAYLWYRKQSSDVADRWYRGLRDAMRGLNQNAERFPLADEDDTFPYRLREMLYGLGRKKTHRVLFVIRPKAVVIYAIRHVAQERFNPYP